MQSAAIAALIVSGKLPPPDVAAIVDTGREKQSTWDYLDQIITPALQSKGIEMHRISKQQFATVDLWSTAGDLLLPVFTAAGKMPTYCSNEWKRRVMMRWLKFEYGSDIQVLNWLGISCDEMSRVRVSDVRWLQHRYPLIELGMSRIDCLGVVQDIGWPDPPRSSCWMCPNMRDEEWKAMESGDMQKAISFDEAMAEQDPEFYLTRERVRLKDATFNILSDESDSGCASGYCFV